MKSNKLTWLIILIVALAVVIGLVVGLGGDKNEVSDVEVTPTAENAKGNLNSPLVLIEYSDFQCPACASYYPVVKEVAEKYADGMKFVYVHRPLASIHPNATIAAQATEAAAVQGAFWEMHDLLFERQSRWSGKFNPRKTFIGYAEELGLDTEMFEAHMNSTAIRDKVSRQSDEAAEAGINGTPTFILNGEQINPQASVEAFSFFIEPLL